MRVWESRIAWRRHAPLADESSVIFTFPVGTPLDRISRQNECCICFVVNCNSHPLLMLRIFFVNVIAKKLGGIR